MDSLLQDVKFGFKLLSKDKSFAATAIVTLALCIGANTAIFSVINAVLLRSLPYDEADRIVLLYNSYPAAGAPRDGASAVDYFERLEQTDAFEELAMYAQTSLSLGESEDLRQVVGLDVTPSLFRLLRTEPLLGQIFEDPDAQVGENQKAILSFAAWQQYFGAAEDVVGSDLRLDGVPHRIVGVLPADFYFGSRDVRIFRPIAFTARQKLVRHDNDWQQIARLRSGVSLDIARQQIDALNVRNLDSFPRLAVALTNAGFVTHVVDFQDDLVRDVRSTLYLLWAGVLFVLLIGCVNIANLMMVRSSIRRRELATRLAFGAGYVRLARQLVTESVVLTSTGGLLGLLIGYWGLKALESLGIDQLPRSQEIAMDATVIGATVGLALLLGFLIGIIPVTAAVRTNIGAVFHEDVSTVTTTRTTRFLRHALVTAQVAFALVLLIGAGLMFASFREILDLDLGYETTRVLTGEVTLPATRYATDEELAGFAEAALAEIRAAPGVIAAGATSVFPLSGKYRDGVVVAEGYAMPAAESLISPSQVRVTPGYLEAMDIELIQGRYFDETDIAGTFSAVIVDQQLADRFWPDVNPLGARLFYPTDDDNFARITEETTFLYVVGVVENVALREVVREEGETVGAYYLPYAQSPDRALTFAIKTVGDPGAAANPARSIFAKLDAGLPLFNLRSMDDRLTDAIGPRRTPVVLSMGFALVALLLSALGVYGVLAYQVATRTREIGIRLALGSGDRLVFRLVLREGLSILGVGIVFGLSGAFAMRSTLQSQLYGVEPLDPIVWTSVVVLLAVVALLACVVPARRATRVDPVVALGQD